MGERAPALPLLLLISACVLPPASPLHRWAELHVSTNGICHYANRVDCCWGWTRESWGQCRPVCELGCKHGVCVGPDQCLCHPGYTGKTCNQDVNECGLKPRPCKHRCINMVGSYKCYCLNGFMRMHDGSCRSAQTCAMANCQYGCAVMKGEVVCQCPSPGLQLGPDRRTCVDVDECVTGVAKCPRFRKCVNTFSSYICKCHKGFELHYVNGKYQCTDKNENIFCRDNPDSKKCKCKFGTSMWSHDCTPPIIVTVHPARPHTTPRPTTKTTIATVLTTTSLPPATIKPSTVIAMTTTTTTTTTTSTTTTSTTPTTTVTSAMTTSTEPTTVTMTTEPTTAVPTSEPTTVTTTTETIYVTIKPTTVATTTLTTVVTTMNHEPTTKPLPNTATLITMTTTTSSVATTATTSNSTTTISPMTVPPITTTLDNRIQEITQRPRGDVQFPKNSDQNVFEYFDVELGNTAEFLRDDPGSGSLSCSFDQGMCEWMSDQEGDLPWETAADPAGRRFLMVPEPKTGRSLKGARLTIPFALAPVPPWKEGAVCLAFKHLLRGHLIGSLQLFVRRGRGQSHASWTRTGGHGWRKTQMTLRGRGISSVVFKAERRRGRRGEIAIDDVSLHSGACSIKKRV